MNAEARSSGRSLDLYLQTEERLRWELGVNTALTELSNALAASSSVEDVSRVVLEFARALTGSKHGYVSSIDPRVGDNVGHAMTALMREQCMLTRQDGRAAFSRGPDGQYPGLCGHALNTGQAFYTNAPRTYKASQGHPKGHTPFKNLLSAPAVVGNEVLGQIALADSDREYTERDLAAIKQLAELHGLAVQRKQREQILQENQEQFRLLSGQSLLGVAIIQDGLIKYANQAVSAIIEVPVEEIMDWQPNQFGEVIHPDDRAFAMEQALKKQMGEQDAVTHYSYRITARSGAIKWVEQYSKSVVYKGRYADFVTLINITQQRLAEEALRVEQAHLEWLVEGAPEAIVLVDNDSRVLRVNAEFTRMFGYTADDVRGRSIDQILAPDHLREEAISITRRVAQGERTSIETVRRRRDGSLIDVSIIGAPIRVDGEQIAVYGIYRDITERKRAERLLDTLNVAAQAMQRALTHHEIFGAVARELSKLACFCALFLVDESQDRLVPKYLGYQTAAIETVEKLTGVSARGVALPIEGVHVFGRVVRHQETVYTEHAEEIARQLLPGPLKGFASQIIRILRVSKTIIAPLIVDDQVIGMLSVQSDDLTQADRPHITAFAHQMAAVWHKASLMQDLKTSLEELRQTQHRLVHAQKMEAVGRLAGGVAHDFNNILTTITGYSSLLLTSLSQDDPRFRDAEEISKAADRAAALTRQLLAFSRRQVLRPTVIDLNAIIVNIQKMLQRLIGEDVELHTLLDPSLGRVRADPGQIEQVIMNLAINACDAMPSGGKLTLKTANVEIDEMQTWEQTEVSPGRYAMLAVIDTGIGMDEATQAHLFEPFFTTKEVGRGTGLGLSTVYGIVKQSKGHIEFSSAPGQGTTFRVYLPGVDGAVASPSHDQVPMALPRGTETLMLVEDEEPVRRLASRVLTECGYVVLEASDPGKAVLLAERYAGTIHLLLTDVVMPKIGGRELAERLTVARGGMKVLYVSGHTSDDIAHYETPDSGVGFLQKPFTPMTLALKVRDLLDASIVRLPVTASR